MSKYYVLGNDNCRYEGMSKEQILAAIEQAVNEGEIKDIDTGFVSQLKELNRDKAFKVWIGTEAEYNLIPKANIETGCLYITTDDNSMEQITSDIAEIKQKCENFGEMLNNEVVIFETNENYVTAFSFSGSRAEKFYELIQQHSLFKVLCYNSNGYTYTLLGYREGLEFNFSRNRVGYDTHRVLSVHLIGSYKNNKLEISLDQPYSNQVYHTNDRTTYTEFDGIKKLVAIR